MNPMKTVSSCLLIHDRDTELGLYEITRGFHGTFVMGLTGEALSSKHF